MTRRARILFVVTVAATVACHHDAPTVADPLVAGQVTPVLPPTPFVYVDASNPAPAHFVASGAGSATALDNTPGTNPITNAGAALGRVLFYDPRLSANDQVSCSSCHLQSHGFGDTARFSRGFAGGLTTRHAMALANARYYQNGRFFWDERAATLEAQVLQPIQNAVEMGMTLEALQQKIAATTYYPPLFLAAFGTTEVNSDRISRALAQFVRSLVSASSRFDGAFGGGQNLVPGQLTAQEQQGNDLFISLGCAQCHRTNSQSADQARNTGLDATVTDPGVGGAGRFKVPSLRNVAVRPPYMHDGRFRTLDEVVAFYDSGVQPNPNLDNRLKAGAAPRRLNLSAAQRASIVAYLGTLTDPAFLTAARFSNPFAAH